MKAWQLLKTKKQWCQEANAKTAMGSYVSAHSKFAAQWCLLGALAKCYGEEGYLKPFKKCSPHMAGNPVIWNDSPTRKFSEVKALLKKLDI